MRLSLITLVICISLLSNLTKVSGAIIGCSDPKTTKVETSSENEVNIKKPSSFKSVQLMSPEANMEKASPASPPRTMRKNQETKISKKSETSSVYKNTETETFFEKEARETYSSPWIDILTSGVGSGMLTYGLTADNNTMAIGGGIVLLWGARGFRDHGWLKLASILGFGAAGIQLGNDHNDRLRKDRESQTSSDQSHKLPPPKPPPSISIGPTFNPSNGSAGLRMSVSY